MVDVVVGEQIAGSSRKYLKRYRKKKQKVGLNIVAMAQTL
jgi:hypothetical protein